MKGSVSLSGPRLSESTGPDFSWIEQGREMRKELKDEVEDGAPLFADAEIKRLMSKNEHLNRQFSEESQRLIKERDYLRSEFVNETERLINERDYLRSEFVNETGRLIEEVNFLRSEFARETVRLTSETARLTNEIGRFQAASLAGLLLLRGRARFTNMIKALPPPMLLSLRWIRKNLRRRVKAAQPSKWSPGNFLGRSLASDRCSDRNTTAGPQSAERS